MAVHRYEPAKVQYQVELPTSWRKVPPRKIGDVVTIPRPPLWSDMSRIFAGGRTGRIIGYAATSSAWAGTGRVFDYAVEVEWYGSDGERVVGIVPIDEWELSYNDR